MELRRLGLTGTSTTGRAPQLTSTRSWWPLPVPERRWPTGLRSIRSARGTWQPTSAKLPGCIAAWLGWTGSWTWVNSREWGSIRCKHVVRGQHLSQIKARLLWLVENVLSPIKTQQPKSGTSAATYRLMEPQWRPPDSNPAKTVTHWKYPGSKISY